MRGIVKREAIKWVREKSTSIVSRFSFLVIVCRCHWIEKSHDTQTVLGSDREAGGLEVAGKKAATTKLRFGTRNEKRPTRNVHTGGLS
jgi:hypothetical protein